MWVELDRSFYRIGPFKLEIKAEKKYLWLRETPFIIQIAVFLSWPFYQTSEGMLLEAEQMVQKTKNSPVI